MVLTTVITSFAEMIPAAVEASSDWNHVAPWYRGSARASWALVPYVHRSTEPHRELNMANRFLLRAKSRHAKCPPTRAAFEWLSLMQHYGLPTRLLDWTESLFVAAFFAVWEDYDEDAAIWLLNAQVLNEHQIGRQGILMSHRVEVSNLAVDAFNKSKPVDQVLAVSPSQIDARLMIQRRCFTIHGGPKPLEDLPKCDEYLRKIVIPKDRREHVKQCLAMGGFDLSTLFPDLQHLAMHLRQSHFLKDTPPADPALALPQKKV